MLYIELKVNYKTIRTIGVRNVSSIPVFEACTAECPYDVWDFTNVVNSLADRVYIGKLRHTRSDGAEVLAQKVLKMVAEHDLGDKNAGD